VEGFWRDSRRRRRPPTGRREPGDEDETDENIPVVDNTGFSLYLPSVTGKELVKQLKAFGWVSIRIEGSHHILVRGTRTISVPVHGKKDLKKGTLEALRKQGGLK
jgi:predicted RNA binding protein YcfA (HicA-like mRNA interferase family)